MRAKRRWSASRSMRRDVRGVPRSRWSLRGRSVGHPLRVKDRGKHNDKKRKGSSSGATVYVCRKCDDHQCVMDVLTKRTDARVVAVRCQKVCEGALAGTEVDGRLEGFERGSGDPPRAAARGTC